MELIVIKWRYTIRSTEEGSINRTLYVQNLDTDEKRKLSTQIGDNSIKFSENFKYYMNSYSNANTAPLLYTS